MILTSRPEQALASIGGSVSLLALLLDPAHAAALVPAPESAFLKQEDGAPYLPLPPNGGLRYGRKTALSGCPPSHVPLSCFHLRHACVPSCMPRPLAISA